MAKKEKIDKAIEEAVSDIMMSMWRASNRITEGVLRKMEEQLIERIHVRWEATREYEQRNNNH